MKKKYILLSLLLIIGFSSCYNEGFDESLSSNLERDFSFRFSGEFTTEYTPLTRSFNSNDLIGIQVYKDGEGYAYGLFDNVDAIKLKLKADSKYKFVVTIVKDGKNLIAKYSDGYKLPFWYKYGNSAYYYYYKSSNSFSYGGDTYYYNGINLGLGKSSYVDGNIYNYPQTDRYYGELDNYTPKFGDDPAVIDVNLKRTAFGLMYEVRDISDGSVSITIKNSSRTFFEKSEISENYTSEEKVFTFSDVRGAWLYSDNYIENVDVSMKWTRGIGIVQDLGTKTVQIKRNAINNIRVTLSEDYGGSALSINVENAELGNESINIPVKQ